MAAVEVGGHRLLLVGRGVRRVAHAVAPAPCAVEDLVGAIVGEMRDEHSREGPSIQRLSSGRDRVDPRTPVADFAHHFGIQIEAGSAATVGGLVIERLRRIPAIGDELTLGPVKLTVEAMDGPRIASLLAERAGGG